VQLGLLNTVAGSLKPGGRLVYAVCTITRRETTAVAAAFGAAHPELEAVALSAAHGLPSSTTIWPQEHDSNGMFIATWRRK
jgi:16S rRNA (cytosine967-C5)-methyltransferase